MAEPQWRPFRWKGLPKYTRESAALLASFSRYLSVSSDGPRLLTKLAKVASDIFRQPVTLQFDHVRAMSFAEVEATVPENGCLVRVGMAPKAEKILWELDPVLAAALVERLLGGRGEDVGLARPFTDIERGVLTYGLLKLLSAFQTGLEQGSEVAVRIESVEQSIEPFRHFFQDDLTMHALSIKVGAGALVGFSRVFIPHTLTAGAFSLPYEEEGTPAAWAAMRRNLQRIGDVTLLARIQIATIDLTPEDIQQLDVGDIVLLEHHALRGSADALAGTADMRIARGKNGVLRLQLLWRNGRLDVQIAEIALAQEPQNMSNEDDPHADIEEADAQEGVDDHFAENEGLLRDVPAPVVVELGRLKLSTSQVIRLKAGQILRLGRGPSDPVDLVVNNRVFARGELIEVDGEIGVRLVQLAK